MLPFREVQRFGAWVDALFGFILMGMLVAYGVASRETADAWPILIGPLALAAIYLGLMRMETVISEQGVLVTFGYIPTYRYRLGLDQIVSFETVQYGPIREYGGWGIRGMPVQALNAQGNRGVRLQLANGRTLLIGSQLPEDLEDALREAKARVR